MVTGHHVKLSLRANPVTGVSSRVLIGRQALITEGEGRSQGDAIEWSPAAGQSSVDCLAEGETFSEVS